jgi:hypothetical protein
LTCGYIEWMRMTQVWSFRNGNRQMILMIARPRWQWSSIPQSWVSQTSISEKWYHYNSRRRCVEVGVRTTRLWNRFTVWVPGGMYSPWPMITTMSSGHTVTEYQLDTSGLQPMFCTCLWWKIQVLPSRCYRFGTNPWKNRLKIAKNHDFWCKKIIKKLLVWCDDDYITGSRDTTLLLLTLITFKWGYWS